MAELLTEMEENVGGKILEVAMRNLILRFLGDTSVELSSFHLDL